MPAKAKVWTKEEDDALTQAIEELSCPNCIHVFRPDCACEVFKKQKTWKNLGEKLERSHGSCQARWCNVLDPCLDQSPWTEEMDEKLLRIYQDEQFPTWVTRAKEMSKPGKRRNGGEVAARYFMLKKKQGKKKSKDDEEEDNDEDDQNEEEEGESSKKKKRVKQMKD
jgi:hypothetical protein